MRAIPDAKLHLTAKNFSADLIAELAVATPFLANTGAFLVGVRFFVSHPVSARTCDYWKQSG